MSTEINIENSERRYALAFSLTLIGAVMFSAKGLFIKFAYQYQVDTVTLLVIRMGISVPIYMMIGIYSERFNKQRISRQQMLAIAAFGIVGYYLASYLDMQGLQYISVSLERVVLYLYPTFVLLLSVIVLKQMITLKEVFAILLAYSGIILIFIETIDHQMNDMVFGAGLVALSALAFAVFLIGSDRHIKIVGSVRFTAYAMSAAGAAVFLHYALSDQRGLFEQHQQVYFWGAVLALISTIIPTFFMAYGMKVLGAKKVSLLAVIGPVSTMVLGVVFLGDRLSNVQIAGAIVVVMAVTFIVISNKADKDKQ